MPANCSKDLTLVIDYMDNILMYGSADEQYALKAKFGLEALEYNDDFGAYVLNKPCVKPELTKYSPVRLKIAHGCTAIFKSVSFY